MTVAVCDTRTRLLSLLADLVDYPEPGLPAKVAECRALVGESSPRAGALLDAFLDDLERTSSSRLEELYAVAFDLEVPTDVGVTCYPYVGHHLLGESYRRSRFMVGLLERYGTHGFDVGAAELPDHLVVMLRFLAHAPDSELAEELVGEALLPALGRMTHEGDESELRGESGRRVYLRVVEAIRLVLGEQLWPGTPPCSYPLALEPDRAPQPSRGCVTS